MRFSPILFVVLCLASFADARPARRCIGGNCSPPAPQVVLPDPAPAVRPFSPRDLTMGSPVAQPATVAAPTVQSCSGGQCGVSPTTWFGRVTSRVFRR